jgi:hypothetical protein
VATYTISGSGTQTLNANVGALHFHFASVPTTSNFGHANPRNVYGLALFRAGDGTAWFPAKACDAEDFWLPLPTGTTELGYAIFGGVSCTATEVFGTSPLAVTPISSIASYTWTNQGSSTSTLANAVLFLSTPSASAGGVRVFTKAIPTVPYVATIEFTWASISGSTSSTIEPACGMVFRESSTGKLHTCGISFLPASANGAGSAVQSRKWTSATVFSSDYINRPSQFGYGSAYRWMRISDDNTNRKFDISADGLNWLNVHSVARLDFLTGGANQIGFFMRSDSDTTGTLSMSIASYKES